MTLPSLLQGMVGGDKGTFDSILNLKYSIHAVKQWRTQEFCSGGGGAVQQIRLRTEDRENGDLGVVAP
jgi:hypothetical protein